MHKCTHSNAAHIRHRTQLPTLHTQFKVHRIESDLAIRGRYEKYMNELDWGQNGNSIANGRIKFRIFRWFVVYNAKSTLYTYCVAAHMNFVCSDSSRFFFLPNISFFVVHHPFIRQSLAIRMHIVKWMIVIIDKISVEISFIRNKNKISGIVAVQCTIYNRNTKYEWAMSNVQCLLYIVFIQSINSCIVNM